MISLLLPSYIFITYHVWQTHILMNTLLLNNLHKPKYLELGPGDEKTSSWH